jgi:hypothetical protein
MVWLLGKCDLPFRRVGVAAYMAEHGAPLAGSGNTIMMALKTLLCCPRPALLHRGRDAWGAHLYRSVRERHGGKSGLQIRFSRTNWDQFLVSL